MTIAPYWLDEPHTQSVLVENSRTFDKCAVEALGRTFGLLIDRWRGYVQPHPVGGTIGIAVVAGTVDFAVLFGGEYLVTQVIAGAFTGIAFLTLWSGRPMMCVEVHILGAKFVITMGSNSRRDRGVDVGYDRTMDQRAVGGQVRRRRTGLRRFRWALASG
jgi:hypothetical protein